MRSNLHLPRLIALVAAVIVGIFAVAYTNGASTAIVTLLAANAACAWLTISPDRKSVV